MRHWRVLAISCGLAGLCFVPVHSDEIKEQGQSRGEGQSHNATGPEDARSNGEGKVAGDRGKTSDETLQKDVLKKLAAGKEPAIPTEPRADLGKSLRIEPPAKKLVREGSALVDADANPKVSPGLVRWHKDFAAACAAARKSGKPVLLFQMMGRLDDRFC